MTRRWPWLALATVLVAACGGSPILANPALSFPAPPTPRPAASRPPDPIPIAFPRDDGPHDRLTEWWYYTGHLRTAAGRRFGFEAVVFRAERGTVPVTWASHLALTDEAGDRFLYAQRTEVGPQVDQSPRDTSGAPTGFDLSVAGLVPMTGSADGVSGAAATPWRLAGSNGLDHISAALAPGEVAAAGGSFGLQLDLRTTKPPALHDGDGFVDFGAAGSSYYYSRTRMAASGTISLDGTSDQVDGIAWFDHQWGDFVSVGGGGWDWFAINLDDGRDVTLSVVRDTTLSPVLRYGTLVAKDGTVARIDGSQFTIDAMGTWSSPRSGNVYPRGWSVSVGGPVNLAAVVQPTVADQELDTGASTGVAYWEGSNDVLAAAAASPGKAIGQAYVELTRYLPEGATASPGATVGPAAGAGASGGTSP